MDEHIIKCNTETRRNKEQVKNIKHIVLPNPKEKQGISPVWLPILLQRETSYGLGCTTTDIFDTRNQSSPRETKHLTRRDTESYLVPDG